MAILEHEVRAVSKSDGTDVYRHLFTRNDYRVMAEDGRFGDKRVELIEGEIIEMAPIGFSHAALTHPLARMLEEIFGSGYTIRNQAPIVLGEDLKPSEPQPDLAVVVGEWTDYLSRHPVATEVALVVEIAESSLAADRAIKIPLYGSADIPEYWIVNVVDRQREVYRDPFSVGYRQAVIYRAGDVVAPLQASGRGLPLDAIFPPLSTDKLS